jgi:CO/xanthine dehydrogenase Mo-binding subunit
LRIDTGAAEALPGVRAVMTAADLPAASDKIQNLGEGAASIKELSDNVLASTKALYKGHAVAAVAATSPRLAAEALARIVVDYEPLPPVLDVRQAMRTDAPLLDETRRTRSLAGVGDQPSNVASHLRMAQGDVAAGFAEADLVVEREFTTQMVHQGYVEPDAATALWAPDGQITVWSSARGTFLIRAQLAEILQVPVLQIKVVPMEIGGAFGGKAAVYLQPVAAVLSRKTGRPVKLQMSRTEVFEATGPASGTYIKLKLGATRDGKLVAAEGTLAYEAGAFPGSMVIAGCAMMLAPYDIPNVRLDGYDVVVNKPKTAAYRAPGAPAAAFACESVVDELAERLGLDPFDFRLRNASREGTRQTSGALFRRIGNVECLEAARNSDHYRSPLWPESPLPLGEGIRPRRSSAAVASPTASGPTAA